MNINENIFKQHDIGVAFWPTNFLDLNPIKSCWGYEKDMLEDYNIDDIIIENAQFQPSFL